MGSSASTVPPSAVPLGRSPEAEAKLRRRLREIARAHPRWGFKTAYSIVRREGWVVNRKRIQRLWRQEGLRRPADVSQAGLGPTLTDRLRASRANQVWAVDFQFDETADQRRLKMANVVDEFTREGLAIRVGRSCDADQLIDVLEVLMVASAAHPSTCAWTTGPR